MSDDYDGREQDHLLTCSTEHPPTVSCADWARLDRESLPIHEAEPREIDWSKPYADCTPEEQAVRDAYRGPGQKNLASSRYEPTQDPGVPGRWMVMQRGGRVVPDFPGSDDEFADAIKVLAKTPVMQRGPQVEVHTTGRQFGKNISTPLESPGEQEQRIRRALGLEPRPIVIGLGGYQEHGKDALADILVERHGFMKFGMSDAINEILMVLNPWVDLAGARVRYADVIESVGYTEAKKHPEIRRLLRTLGTEVGRDMIDPDIWVNIAGKKIRAALHDGASGVVVTGIRNGGNEIGLIRMYGGTTAWVDRPGHPIPDTTHASENTLGPDDFERRVINDGTLEDLKMAADMLVGGIRERRHEQGR